MSQLLQQNDADSQRHLNHDSPTAGRNQTYYSPNTAPLTSDAGKRLVLVLALPERALTPILVDRSQRKAAPSPLQTSTIANSSSSTTPTKSSFSDRRPAAEHTSPRSTSLQEQYLSPKERLNDLLATEKAYHTTGESSLGIIPEENSSR